MTGRLRRTLCAAIIVLTAAMVATGCGGSVQSRSTPQPSPAKTLSWDLSRGHTTEQVRWPAEGTAFEMRRGIQVNLTLPAGKTFTGQVDKVLARREGENIRNLELFYPATTTDQAYQQAKRLGPRWDINLRNIDAWYKRRVAQRNAGQEDFSDTAFTGDPDSRPLGGEDGPIPAIEMFNSFSRERPVIVKLSFLWSRPR